MRRTRIGGLLLLAVLAGTALLAVGGAMGAAPRDGVIVFAMNEGGVQTLYSVHSDGSKLKSLGVSPASGPAWSSNGKRIVFASGSPATHLSLVGANGAGVRALPSATGFDWDPTWSPDGRFIAFSGNQPQTSKNSDSPLAIWVMRSNGRQPRQLTVPGPGPIEQSGEGDWNPSWSPDGKTIAFTRYFLHDPNEYAIRYSAIYLVNPDGSNLRRLSADNSQDFEPAWSPDGKRIAFVSARDHNGVTSIGEAEWVNGELYVMNADGSNQTRITNNSADDRSPTWSPDGKWLAFSRGREGPDNSGPWLYVMPSSGGKATRITKGDGWSQEPAWKPR